MNISIIGMPLFYGCDRLGVDQGPKILRENKVIDIFARKHNVVDLGDISIPFLDAKEKFLINSKMKYLNEVIECNTSLAKRVYLALNNGTLPFILGGDHSLALGSLAGASKYFNDDLAVIWIDAHGDLNTHETSPSGNIHGMPLAASIGLGYESLTSILFNKRKVNPENIFLLGCRDLDSGEIKLINDLDINMWTIEDIKNKGAKVIIQELLKKIESKNLNNIHLSYDIDCLDPSYVPGTGTPVNNGLTFEESQILLHGIFSTSHVKCIDFVEYNPELDKHNKTRETCIQLINLISEELH
ncbi:MAG: arginase [Clostridium sp.]|nr:arginase [Clostridium sp.]